MMRQVFYHCATLPAGFGNILVKLAGFTTQKFNAQHKETG